MSGTFERRWRAVVLLAAVGLALLTAGGLTLSGLSLALLEQFLEDEFLFFLGLILSVVLLPAAVLPLGVLVPLWRLFVRMVRGGPQDRSGPRLLGIEVAAGFSLILAGATLYPEPHALPILGGGAAVLACALAAFRIAATAPKAGSAPPVRPPDTPDRPAPPGQPAAPQQAEWAWHLDLTRRGRDPG